jgi:hypothetical protein
MDCRSAQRLLSADQDGAPATREHAALDVHLAECAKCQRFRASVADAAEAWRTSTLRVQAPDAELAWQAVRRKIRSGEAAAGTRSAPWFSRWVWPLGAAAALAALAVVVGPRWRQELAPTGAARAVAQAGFVEVPGATTSSMVFVDEKSGWLVVWAVDEAHPKSG